jgi:hypothetical protein
MRVHHGPGVRHQNVVVIRAIGIKDRDRVTIGGEEVDLS